MIEGLNTVPIDYACLGNHEFDLTAAVLQKRIHEFQVIPSCNSISLHTSGDVPRCGFRQKLKGVHDTG
jgi:hypothetical protein